MIDLMGSVQNAMNSLAAREAQKQTKLLKQQNQLLAHQPPSPGPSSDAMVAQQTLAMLTNVANELLAIRTLLEQRLPER
jgi:hypothetical protein